MPARTRKRSVPTTSATFSAGIALRRPPTSREDRLAFIAGGMKYLDQSGTYHGPWTQDRWIFESEDGDVTAEVCLKTLMDEYVPDQYHTIETVLSIADMYRAGKGLKAK